MIQQEYKNNVQSTQGTIETTGFTIEVNESMFQMLTSNVYNDPKLAVMREWSTNACDACIAANKEIKFYVHLPTLEDSTFYVRDYGTGLAPEDIKGLFSNLGASTKRTSNAYNGTFGIGRMAGLAVSDAFTVESFYEGYHYSYLISMQNGVPVTIFLSSNKTEEENGLKLSIPVSTQDINTYTYNAVRLYKYFDHKPLLNLDIDINLDVEEHISDNWFVQKSTNGYTEPNLVVMSQVAYEIPHSREVNSKGFRGLVIKAPPGSVTFNPGRESLSLNKQTIEYLNNAFEDISKEYVKAANEKMATAKNDYELMTIYQSVTTSAPSSIVSNIDPTPFASDNFKSLFNTTRWNSAVSFNYLGINSSFNAITNNLVTAAVKSRYYKHSKNFNSENTINYVDFFTCNHVIIDVKSKFRSLLNKQFETKRLITWSRRDADTDMDLFLETIKNFLSKMGVQYQLASDIVAIADDSIISKAAPREGFYASKINNYGVITKSEKFKEWNDPSQTFLFVDLKHSKPQLRHDHYIIEDYMDAYRILAKQMEMPPVFGVQKKYKEFIKNSNNWIDLEDYLKEKFSTAIFYRDPDLNIHTLSKQYINDENLNSYPQPIIDYYQEALAYNSFTKNPNTISCKNEIILIKDFGGTLLEYEPFKKIDEEALSTTYKLTFQCLSYRSFSAEEIQHLGKLEHLYAVHSSK